MSDSKKEKTMFEVDEKEALAEETCKAAEAAERWYWDNIERVLFEYALELESALFQ